MEFNIIISFPSITLPSLETKPKPELLISTFFIVTKLFSPTEIALSYTLSKLELEIETSDPEVSNPSPLIFLNKNL